MKKNYIGFIKLIDSKIINCGLIRFSVTSSDIDFDCILISWGIFLMQKKASLTFSWC